jgi:spermidine/putrescine-binding protein
MYFIFDGAKNLDASYAYLNTALSPQGQAIMAKKMELNVSNQEAYKSLPADLVKKLGFEQANDLIAGSEFNILPDPEPKPPYVSIRDLYTAFDEIKAAVKK